MDAPDEMRVALKTVFMCLSKKYGRRAISSLGYVLFGELFSSTVRNIHQDEHMDALTPEGIRFLASMASVLSKLSVNESFAGGSKLYYMNGWIQSRCDNFEKGLEKMLTVDGPAIGAWNSGCSVLGSVPNLYVLLRALTEHKDDINRVCMTDEWQTYSTQSFYQSRLPILWAALDSGRRRSAETFSSPPRSMPNEKARSPERPSHAHKVAMPSVQNGLIGEMVNMFTQQSKQSVSKVSASESAASRMEHLSATVTQMDLDSRGLDAVPKLEHFKNLQTLNISRNHIFELGELPRSLRSLDCSNNQLSHLAGVECLVNLEVLNCSHNLLEEISSALATRYVATGENGAVVGWAYLDTHRVRTLPETLMIVLDSEGTVRRVEVVTFREPLEYMPREGWYGQYEGQELDDNLALKRDIRPVTGATLTARATNEAVRRVLAIHAVVAQEETP